MNRKILLTIVAVLIAMPYCAGNRHVHYRPIPLEKKPELPKEQKKVKPAEETESPAQMPAIQTPGIYQSGIASWYGGKFQGRRTSNGEIYDMHKLTAAHKELPFNTLVEVENTQNQKKVLVRINDRGPFVKQRIIDLSYKAAQKIDMADTGTAPVKLRIISSGGTPLTGTPPDPGITPPQNTYFLQAGAYRDRDNAHNVLQRILAAGPGIPFKIYQDNGLYRIVSDNMDTRQEALEAKYRLDRAGLESFIKETMRP